MMFQFAYQFTPDVLQSGLRDLDGVVLTVPLASDDGDLIAAGIEGTIVSVHGDSESYVVEFAEPMGALVTAEAHEVRAAKAPVERQVTRRPSQLAKGPDGAAECG